MSFVPTQTQLYALYTAKCVTLRIVKPNKHLLDLLEEENYDRRRQVALTVNGRAGDADMPISITPNTPMCQLASVPDMHRVGPLGVKGMLAFVALFAECPRMEVFDISSIPSIFAVDAYKECPAGNVALGAIRDLIATHPSLMRVNMKGHPVGTMGAAMLLEGLRSNGSVIELVYDDRGVAVAVNRQIEEQLEMNRNGANSRRPESWDFSQLSPRIAVLAFVDRKSSAQRLALRSLLDITFGPNVFADEHVLGVSSLVTLGEAALRASKDHLYLIEHGSIELAFGPVKVLLGRGDYYGEPVNDILHSSGLMSVLERGTAFMIPLSAIRDVTRMWADNVTERLPLVRNVPLLQPLPMWLMCRLCHSAEVLNYTTMGEVIVTPNPQCAAEEAGNVNARGLSIVRFGSVRVQSVRRSHAPESGASPQPNAAVPITSPIAVTDKSSDVVALGPLDMMGHDLLVGRGSIPRRYTCGSEAGCSLLRLDSGVVRRHVLPSIRESLLADLAGLPK